MVGMLRIVELRDGAPWVRHELRDRVVEGFRNLHPIRPGLRGATRRVPVDIARRPIGLLRGRHLSGRNDLRVGHLR